MFYIFKTYFAIGGNALRLILSYFFLIVHREYKCCTIIDYHLYAKDTQPYISLKCKNLLESLIKLIVCITEIRVCPQIKDKLFIKNRIYNFQSSTFETRFEWLVCLRMQNIYTQNNIASKVRGLGVVFGRCLTLAVFVSLLIFICVTWEGLGTFIFSFIFSYHIQITRLNYYKTKLYNTTC